MSGSVNAISYRLGSSMTWGYSTSPIFVSLKVKNSILFSKLLPAVFRRFCLHVVEFYSFFDSSFLLYVLVSRLLALQQRVRRRFSRRRSRKKKAFHRITYSLNKNFSNWRILSFVRNSFRSYRRVSRMMSFIFYNRLVRFRLRYRRLLKKARIGRLVFKYLKRTFFSPNFKFNTARNKKHYAHSLLTTWLGRRTFLSNLSRFSFFLSPFLFSRCFLRNRGFFYKHYNKKSNAVRTAKKIRFKKNKPRNKFNKSGKRFISRPRKPFFRRGRFQPSRFSTRTKSISFYSFKALFRRTNILHFLFLLSFVRFFVGPRVSSRTKSTKFKSFYSVNLPTKRSGIITFFKNVAPIRLSRSALSNYQIKTLSWQRNGDSMQFSLFQKKNLLSFLFCKTLAAMRFRRFYRARRLLKSPFLWRKERIFSLLRRNRVAFFAHRRKFPVLRRKQKYTPLKKSSRMLLRRNGKNRAGSRKFPRTLQNKKRLSLKKSSRVLWRRKNKKLITLKKNPQLLIKRLVLKKKSKNLPFLFPKLRIAPRYFFVATGDVHRKRFIEFFKELCFLRSVRRNRRRYGKVKKSFKKSLKKSSKKRFSRKFRTRRWRLARHISIRIRRVALKATFRILKKKYKSHFRLKKLFVFGRFLLTRGRFGFSSTRRFFFSKNKKNTKRYHLSFRLRKRINRLVKKNLRLFVNQKNKLLLFEKFFFRGLAFSRSAAFLHRIRLKLFAKKKWLFKKNFEFFISEFLCLLVGLPMNVVLCDGLSLFNRFVHSDRLLAIKLVFKRAFIGKKNYFFFKNFVNLLFQSIFFKTIWSLTRYFSRVYYYRKTQKYTTQTVNRIFKTINVCTLRFVGINLLISGKIGRRRRAKTICYTKNKLPNLSTLSLKVQYCYTQCITNFGVYGIKVWLYVY